MHLCSYDKLYERLWYPRRVILNVLHRSRSTADWVCRQGDHGESDLFDKSRLPRAMGLYTIGIYFGAGIAMIAPTALRGQLGAVFMLAVGVVGGTLGPILPAFFSDYILGDEQLLYLSLSLTAAIVAPIADFRWHDLRHIWASWLRQNDVPTWVLQKLGGWKSESMVRRYAHMSVKHLAPYADQLTFSVTLKTGGNPPIEVSSEGHKNGHSESRTQLRLVAGTDLSN